jgi:hypothetical protein
MDWRELAKEDQLARWAGFLEADREQGMELTQAPLSRLALIRLSEDRFKFLWTVPALLLDGWSWPLVFREVSVAYEALCQNQTPQLPAVRPYRNLVAWLRARSWSATEDFWRGRMAGLTEPTPLAVALAPSSTSESRRHAEWSEVLDPSMSGRLVALARRLQLAPNTLIQAAWGLVLARLSGRTDVVFGAAFAGRPADLEGAGDTVGPFVNNLPVRVSVDASMSVVDFLREMQAQMLHLNEHQFAPLAQIQSWSKVPWRHRLFESLVVVQNYQVDEAARRLGPSVEITDFTGPIHTNFPLLILIEPEAAWRLTLIYDTRELPETAIRRWGQDLVRTLAALDAKTEADVESVLAQLSQPDGSMPAKRRWRVSTQNYVPPQTELEGKIARVWEEMLQLEKIGTGENIFDMGAHSLLVVQLHRRLCEAIGRNFPLVTLFQFPTIQCLSKHLDGWKNADPGSLVDVRTRAQRQREALARLQSRGGRR